MKAIFTELAEDVLLPVIIISGLLVVAFVFYAILGYLLIIKMLLRELFLLLDSKSTEVTEVAAIEVTVTRNEEVKLIAPGEIKALTKPLTIYELRALGRAAHIKGASRLNKASLQLALGIN